MKTNFACPNGSLGCQPQVTLRAEVDCILSYVLMQDYSFTLKNALDTVIADTFTQTCAIGSFFLFFDHKSVFSFNFLKIYN